MNYEISHTIKLRASVLRRIATCCGRRETAHEFGVIKDPSNLLPGQGTLKGNCVSTSGVVIELDSKTLDCQQESSQSPVKGTYINGIPRVRPTRNGSIPSENVSVPAEMDGSMRVH